MNGYKIGALIVLILQMIMIAAGVSVLMAGVSGTVAIIWIFTIILNTVFGLVNIKTILS